MSQAKHHAHQPVLLEEVLNMLITREQGVYVDGTFGRGGHSRALLARLGNGARVVGVDRDPEAIAEGRRLAATDSRFHIHPGRFDCLPTLVDEMGCKFDGILLDLGVSSPQLDDASRGFSFLHDGPLDMRMDPTQGESVADWLSRAEEEAIANVLYEFGEERRSRAIARLICKTRVKTPIVRTTQLAGLISQVVRAEPGKHPATRSFQALRIFINQELVALDRVLEQVPGCLAPGGHLAVISFHSLEDRRVKRFLRDAAGRAPRARGGLPLGEEQLPRLKLVGHAVRASEMERENNPRARSAVLRVAERLEVAA
jgi:16S rRNA (cytosine1402-N4)-methyltransferase